ncbi:SWI/SNF-related matrix-associated actin-dependent regulator of chromatin subfamily A-like protein 1 [Nosema granulosis]|uniref:SWI/SNF-related matrix-associated actin-dependent regulator of chromatin subfamily A-like protein 1 n=1 Tax=Nosema granulosis TaxID=83296 RepID=A0A9P6GZW7_9MICR|nr:SWI/SNF-related matrix-associated actin-dependent regulator of chromatin subfamily A-like protein 1 [Nosema granulosis]
MGEKKENWQEIIQKKLSKNTKTLDVNLTTKVDNQIVNEMGTTTFPCTTNKEIIKPVRLKAFVNNFGTITLKPSSKLLSKILCACKESVYDIKKNEWRISPNDFVSVKKVLFSNRFIFDDLPKGLVALLNNKIEPSDFILNGEIYQKMFSFQKEGVMFSLNRGGRVLLGDEMGLGKTIQALGVAYYYKIEWPLLIISPASLLDNWADAVWTFLGEQATIVRSKSDFGNRISIISYEIASRNSDIIKLVRFGVILCDECHYLKSTTSQRSKKLLPILQSCSRLVLMSGTPAVSRPVELFNVFSALDKTLFPNFMEYGKRYCNARKIGHWYDYKGCTNAEELNYILKEFFMIRRTKEEVLSQLPLKFRRQIILSTKASAETSKENAIGEVVDQSIMAQYAEAATLKLDCVKSYVDTMLERDIKFIIFAHHTVMVDGLGAYLEEKSVEFIRIDGSVPNASRHKLVTEFQTNEQMQVALLSITACSTGLTLTSAKAVVFAELYWNPGTLLQAEDRIHRIGQKDNVDIHYLVAKGTIDEYVWPVLLKKLNVLQSLGIQENNLKKVGSQLKEQKRITDFFK